MVSSGLDDLIGDAEQLARFITSSGHYAKTSGRVKYPAFLPDRIDAETSVFRIDGLEELMISRIGVDNLPNGYFHGAAIVRTDKARAQNLVVAADEPPDRHGVIRGWPIDDDAEIQKSKRMAAAQELAESATFLPKVT